MCGPGEDIETFEEWLIGSLCSECYDKAHEDRKAGKWKPVVGYIPEGLCEKCAQTVKDEFAAQGIELRQQLTGEAKRAAEKAYELELDRLIEKFSKIKKVPAGIEPAST